MKDDITDRIKAVLKGNKKGRIPLSYLVPQVLLEDALAEIEQLRQALENQRRIGAGSVKGTGI